MIAPGGALCGGAWWIESVGRSSLDTEDLSVCKGRLDRNVHAYVGTRVTLQSGYPKSTSCSLGLDCERRMSRDIQLHPKSPPSGLLSLLPQFWGLDGAQLPPR
jgi:hypothetical protein